MREFTEVPLTRARHMGCAARSYFGITEGANLVIEVGRPMAADEVLLVIQVRQRVAVACSGLTATYSGSPRDGTRRCARRRSDRIGPPCCGAACGGTRCPACWRAGCAATRRPGGATSAARTAGGATRWGAECPPRRARSAGRGGDARQCRVCRGGGCGGRGADVRLPAARHGHRAGHEPDLRAQGACCGHSSRRGLRS